MPVGRIVRGTKEAKVSWRPMRTPARPEVRGDRRQELARQREVRPGLEVHERVDLARPGVVRREDPEAKHGHQQCGTTHDDSLLRPGRQRPGMKPGEVEHAPRVRQRCALLSETSFFGPISVPYCAPDRVLYLGYSARPGWVAKGVAMTVQDGFQAAARVEALFRKLYLDLARCFRDHPPASAAFLSLAGRAEQRALRVRLLALQRGPRAGNEDTVEKVTRDIVATLVELSAMAVNVQHDPDGGSALRVLRRLIDAERRCQVVHAEVLRGSDDPLVFGLFSALARKDAEDEWLLRRVVRATRRARTELLPRRSGATPAEWAGGGSFGLSWWAPPSAA